MARLKTALAVSAGGAVFRILEDRIEVALCGRISNGLWGLPKGTPNKGEDLLHTALREVREETGLEVRTLAPIGQIEYWFVARGVRFHKTVHYFLMEATGGDLSLHDPEYDVVQWFVIGEAYGHMSYKNEASIVHRAEGMIRRRFPDLPADQPPNIEASPAEVDQGGVMHSVGVDAIEIDRIARSLERFGERFLRRVYTQKEIFYCQGRVPELAARFAAKEAISKALGTGIRGIVWREMEILPDRRGKPLVYLHGAAAARATELGLAEFAISLTHARELAIAVVVAASAAAS